MRNAIDEYDETSPLYGFLRYRRRNVIIKYLPEDCSRIIQGALFIYTYPCLDETENAHCLRFLGS